VSSKPTEAASSRRIQALGWDYSERSVEHVLTCNLCGGTSLVETARRDRYGYPATYRVCASCGLGFLSPRLTAAEYADFYARIYRPLVSAYHDRRIDAQTLQTEQRAYAAELVELLRTALPEAPRTIWSSRASAVSQSVAMWRAPSRTSGASMRSPRFIQR